MLKLPISYIPVRTMKKQAWLKKHTKLTYLDLVKDRERREKITMFAPFLLR